MAKRKTLYEVTIRPTTGDGSRSVCTLAASKGAAIRLALGNATVEAIEDADRGVYRVRNPSSGRFGYSELSVRRGCSCVKGSR